MKPLTHKMIRASAGSGKTTQLAWRFIALLALGVPPERVVALTFSRKAALEMFERIAQVLIKACLSADDAAWITGKLDPSPPAPPDYPRLLRGLVDATNRLRVGTLDSFTIGLTRAFPFELGVGPVFSTGDEEGARARALLDEALQRLFDPSATPEAETRDFFEAFKRARFGEEQRGLHDRLLGYAADHLNLLRGHPSAAAWGDPARIWPGGQPLLDPARGAEIDLEAARRALDLPAWPPALRAQAEELLAVVNSYLPHLHWKTIEKVVARLHAIEGGLASGRAELTYSRKTVTLGPDACAALRRVLGRLDHVGWTSAVESTQALFSVLERVKRARDRMAAESGFLTFADVQDLLSPLRAGDGLRLDDDRRLQMEYRLDGKLDHWLLDEFQDTSDLQWSILDNLAGEVLTDTGGQRSFFLVGDIKQSIYRWRGGNPLLFDAIVATYGQHLAQEHLDTSFRSSPAVLELVNRVFALDQASIIPPGARALWRAQWREHRVGSERQRALPGYAAVIEVGGDETREASEAKAEAVAALVRALDPAARGWSCAVLTRSNRAGAALANTLRRLCPGIPIHLEGRSALLDDAAVRLLLAVLRLAAHPGDALAAAQVRASPLAGWLRDHPAEAPPEAWLADLQRHGLAGFTRVWTDRLEEAAGPLPGFTRTRLGQLRDAAAGFDESNPPDADAFLAEVETIEVQAPPAASGVRLMTVHASKGLEFDAVILPELDTVGGALAGGGAVEVLVNGDPEWLLRPPATALVERDPAARAALDHERAQRSLESLCVLYVAMTRGRHATYALVQSRAKESSARNENTLLRDQLPSAPGELRLDGETTLPVLWQTGDAGWHETRAAAPAVGAASEPGAPEPDEPFAAQGEPAPLAPSAGAEENRRRPAAAVFQDASAPAKARGVGAHALFEAVEWLDLASVDDLLAMAARVEPDARVVAEVAATLRDPAASACFRRPEGPCWLWREQAVDWMWDGRVCNGVIDRAVVHLDEQGRPLSARITDFKTDRVDRAALAERAAHHRSQMEAYRQALARLLGIPPARVGVDLIFTVLPAVVTVFPMATG